MSIAAPALLFALGLVLVTKGADFLVAGASALSRRLGFTELAIGLTVVAFGTSTPELVVNIFSSAAGRPEIVFGNVIGSNIVNLLLILGVSALIFPLAVQRNSVRWEIPFSLAAALLLLLLVNLGMPAALSRFEAVLLLAAFGGFFFYLSRTGRSRDETPEEAPARPLAWSLLRIGVGLVGLVVGGKLVVDGAVAVARELAVSERLIALTIVSAGTSVPELATSIVAALRRNPDIAVGNVVGSNVFNILFVLGVSGVIRPATYNRAMNIDLLLLAGATVVALAAMFTGKKHRLDRWEAVVLLLLYAAYTAFLVARR